MRPLYIIENNKFLITKEILSKYKNNDYYLNKLIINNNLNNAVIEFIDVKEENDCLIAMDNKILSTSLINKYTHCEIHPSLQTGVLASIIPFSDHNQSPRNTYQSAMGKQAIGIYCLIMISYGYIVHILKLYRNRINNKLLNYLPSNELPWYKCYLAITSYSGYNQEDSILMNESLLIEVYFILFIEPIKMKKNTIKW